MRSRHHGADEDHHDRTAPLRASADGTGSVAVGNGVLTLNAEPSRPEGPARVEHVFDDHPQRVGEREGLVVTWRGRPMSPPPAERTPKSPGRARAA